METVGWDATPEEIMALLKKQHEGWAAKLRETAVDLRAGKMNVHHAANRLAKMAREMDGGAQ